MDPEKLLVKVGLGKPLTGAETDEILDTLKNLNVQSLSKAGIVDEVYALVHLVSKANVRQSAYLIERYLESKDPLLVSLVLETLCLEWELSAAYLERVMSFALGESWDYDEDVRQAALKILGEHLRKQLRATEPDGKKPHTWFDETPKHALEILLGILEDDSLENLTRRAAYCALCRAAGKEYDELPAEYVQIDFSAESKDLDFEMIAKLRNEAETLQVKK